METLPYTHLVHTYTPTNKIISPVIQKIKLSLCPKRRVRIFFWFWGGSLRTWGQPPTHLLRWWGEVKIPTHSPPGWREVGTRYQPDQIIQLGCPPSTIKKRSSWTELRIIPLLSDPQGVTFHFQPPPPPGGWSLFGQKMAKNQRRLRQFLATFGHSWPTPLGPEPKSKMSYKLRINSGSNHYSAGRHCFCYIHCFASPT